MNLLYAGIASGLFMLSTNAVAERVLSADEVNTLFSGNTYEASIPSRGLTMTVYAYPDGRMIGMQNGKPFTSNWSINDRGEICISYKEKMSCRHIMEENGSYKKFTINEQGEKTILVIYTSFAPGNIHNY